VAALRLFQTDAAANGNTLCRHLLLDVTEGSDSDFQL